MQQRKNIHHPSITLWLQVFSVTLSYIVCYINKTIEDGRIAVVNIRIAHPRNAHWRAILRWAILSKSLTLIILILSLCGFGLQLVLNVVFFPQI